MLFPEGKLCFSGRGEIITLEAIRPPLPPAGAVAEKLLPLLLLANIDDGRLRDTGGGGVNCFINKLEPYDDDDEEEATATGVDDCIDDDNSDDDDTPAGALIGKMAAVDAAANTITSEETGEVIEGAKRENFSVRDVLFTPLLTSLMSLLLLLLV